MNTVLSENELRESRLSYPGWRLVLAAFFGVMVSFAALVPYTFSIFLAPLIAAGLTLLLPAYAQGPATLRQAVPETFCLRRPLPSS
jgi:hypothetical protein